VDNPKPRGTWRLWRAGGVDYLVRPSLLLMGAILVVLFAQRFEDAGTRSDPFVLALGFVVGLYVSVLVHEIAHVIAARRFGLRVRSVTLHLLGGETAIEGDSRTPGQELVTAGAGPLASLLIGVACRLADSGGDGTIHDLLWTIGTVNLFVAAFNLIPGLPLDGGRILRAIIWAGTGNEARGIKIAAWIGRVTAVVGVALVIALGLSADSFPYVSLVVAVLVAAFLWSGASAALRHADRTGRVNQLYARRIARPGHLPDGVPTLDADLHGARLLREVAAHPSETYAVAEADGTVIGVLTLDELDHAYRSGASGSGADQGDR